MAPVLETADGTLVPVPVLDPEAVNQEFARAIAGDGPDAQAPPRRPPKVPADPEAPRRGRGRPPKAEQPRVMARAGAGAVLSDAQRAQGVKGYAQIIAGIVLLFGKATGNDAYKADAVTIASAGDEFADAAVQIAHADPKFAAALDKVCAAGPYAAAVTVLVSVGSQCARNHRPALKLPGTVDPAELLRAQAEVEAPSVPAAA